MTEHWYTPFVCPCCSGEGSWTDYIDYWIGGPTERCNYCDGFGRVGLWKLAKWVWTVDIVDNVRRVARRERRKPKGGTP